VVRDLRRARPGPGPDRGPLRARPDSACGV